MICSLIFSYSLLLTIFLLTSSFLARYGPAGNDLLRRGRADAGQFFQIVLAGAVDVEHGASLAAGAVAAGFDVFAAASVLVLPVVAGFSVLVCAASTLAAKTTVMSTIHIFFMPFFSPLCHGGVHYDALPRASACDSNT